MANLQFWGATRNVTGSCFLVEFKDKKILVDCGLFQGPKWLKERNYEKFPFEPREIDCVILTHAHIDHSGMVPKLFKYGYKGPVICTCATSALCSVLLPDSAHIQEMEVERKNRKKRRAGETLLEPIYTTRDAEYCLDFFEPRDYEKPLELFPGITLNFLNAGHILGSAVLELFLNNNGEEIKLVVSGDLGSCNQPIIKDPSVIDKADYLIMESTYGRRLHQEEDRLSALADIINQAMQKGGNLLIPSFAVARTQDLIYDLNLLLEEEKILPSRIFIDSPLAVQATEIFKAFPDCFDDETTALLQRKMDKCVFTLPNLSLSRTTAESIAINDIKSGAIIISASGMCDAGRIKHHLKHNLWRPECTVLFVGYQAYGTLGRRILEGEKVVRIHGEEVAVRAEIKSLDSYSSHADQLGLLQWVSRIKEKPAQVFLVHGEEEAAETMAALLEEHLDLSTHVPDYGEKFYLPPVSRPIPDRMLCSISPGEIMEPSLANVEEAYNRYREKLDYFYNAYKKKERYGELLEEFKLMEQKLQRFLETSDQQ